MEPRNMAPSITQAHAQHAIDRCELAREQRIMIQEANDEMDRAQMDEALEDTRRAGFPHPPQLYDPSLDRTDTSQHFMRVEQQIIDAARMRGYVPSPDCKPYRILT
jgi:hypothetical protein